MGGLAKAFTAAGTAAAATAGAVLSLGGALAVFGAGTAAAAALKFSADFEKSLADVNTILDGSGVSINRYRQQLLKLSTQSSKTLDDLAKGLYQTISAGIPAIEGAGGAFDVLAASQKAAVAGLSTTENAVDATVSVLNAYGTASMSSTEVTDQLLTAVRLGRVRFDDLAKGIGRVTTIAAQANVPLEDILAVLIQLTRQGIKPAEAITGLRNILKSLINPTKQTKDFLGAFNKELEKTGKAQIEFGAEALSQKGLIRVLGDLTTATGGSSTALAKLFPNIRALIPGLVAVGEGFDDVVGFQEALINSSGATAEAFEIVDRTFAETFEKFISNLGVLAVAVSEDSLGALGEQLRAFNDAVSQPEKIAKYTENVNGFIDAIVQFQEVFDIALLAAFAAAVQKLAGFFSSAASAIAPIVLAIGSFYVAATSIVDIGVPLEGTLDLISMAFKELNPLVATLVATIALAADGIFRFGSLVAAIPQILARLVAEIVALVASIGLLAPEGSSFRKGAEQLIKDARQLAFEFSEMANFFLRLADPFADQSGLFGLTGAFAEDQEALRSAEKRAKRLQAANEAAAKALGFRDQTDRSEVAGQIRQGQRLDVGALVDEKTIATTAGELKFLGDELFQLQVPIDIFASSFDKKGKAAVKSLTPVVQKFFLDFEAGSKKSALSAVEIFARLEKEIRRLGKVNAAQAEGVAFLSARRVLVEQINASESKLAQLRFLNSNNQNETLIKEEEARLRNLRLQNKQLESAKSKVSKEREAAEAIAKSIEDEKKQKELDAAAVRRKNLENQLLRMILESEKQRLKISERRAALLLEAEKVRLRDLEIEERINQLRISSLNEELKRRKLIRFEVDQTTGQIEAVLSKEAIDLRKNLQDAFKDREIILKERLDQTQQVIATELEAEKRKLSNAEKNEEISFKKRVAKLQKLQLQLRGSTKPAETIQDFKDNLEEFQKNLEEARNIGLEEFGQELRESVISFQEETQTLSNDIRNFNENFVKDFFNSQRKALEDFRRIEKEKNRIFLDGIRDRESRLKLEQQLTLIAKADDTSTEQALAKIRDQVAKQFNQREFILQSVTPLTGLIDVAIELGKAGSDSDLALKGLSAQIKKFNIDARKGAESTEQLAEALKLVTDVLNADGQEQLEDLQKALTSVNKAIEGTEEAGKTLELNEAFRELVRLTVAERFELENLAAASTKFETEFSNTVSNLADDTRSQIGTLAFDINAIFQNLFGSLRSGLEGFLDSAVNALGARVDRLQFNVSKFLGDNTVDIFGDITGDLRENSEKTLLALRKRQEEITRQLDRSNRIIAVIEGRSSEKIDDDLALSTNISGVAPLEKTRKAFELVGGGTTVFGEASVDAIESRLTSEQLATDELTTSLEQVNKQIEQLDAQLERGSIGSFFSSIFSTLGLGFPDLDSKIADAERRLESLSDVSEESLTNVKTKFLVARSEADKAVTAFQEAGSALLSYEAFSKDVDEDLRLAAVTQLQAEVDRKKEDSRLASVRAVKAQEKLFSVRSQLEAKSAAQKEVNDLKERKRLGKTQEEFTQPFKDIGSSIGDGFKAANQAVEDIEGFEDLVPEGVFEGALKGFGEEFASFGQFLDTFALSTATILTDITTLFGGDGFTANVKSIGTELGNILSAGADFFATAALGALELGADILKQGLSLSFDLFLTSLSSALAPIGTAIAAPLQRLFGSLDSAVSVLADIPDEEDEKRFREKQLELERAQLQNIRLRGQEDISNEELARIQTQTQEALEEEEETAIERLSKEIDRAMKVAVNIAEQLGPLVATFLSKVTDALPTIFPKLVKGLTEALAAFAEGFPELIITLTRELVKALPDIIDAIVNLLPALVTGFIGVLTEVLRELPTIIVRLIDSIVENIPLIIDALVEALPDFIEALALAVPEIIGALIGAIPRIIGALIVALPRLIVALIRAVPLFVTSLARGFGRMISRIFRPFASAVRVFVNGVRAFAESVQSEGGASILGSILGGVAGFLLAPVTGGASLAVAAAGAGVGAASGYGLAQLHSGGNITEDLVNKPLANMFRLAGVQGFLDGGMVGDTLRRRFKSSISDDVPAILQKGEAVLSRKGVAAVGGPSAVDNINSGQAASAPVSVNVGINPTPDGLQNAAAALLPLLVGSIGVNVDGGRTRTKTELGVPLLGYRTVPGVK